MIALHCYSCHFVLFLLKVQIYTPRATFVFSFCRFLRGLLIIFWSEALVTSKQFPVKTLFQTLQIQIFAVAKLSGSPFMEMWTCNFCTIMSRRDFKGKVTKINRASCRQWLIRDLPDQSKPNSTSIKITLMYFEVTVTKMRFYCFYL